MEKTRDGSKRARSVPTSFTLNFDAARLWKDPAKPVVPAHSSCSFVEHDDDAPLSFVLKKARVPGF